VKDQPQKPFEPTESHVDSDVYRESWSFNGEVCITGLVPPIAGGARLAHCLVWLLRSFASRSRTIYNGTGALGFTYSGSRTATTLSWALSLGFDLALQDPQLIRRHVLSRGGEPSACRWPRLWLEGSTYDYILPGVPLPRGNAVKNKLVVLAEERQVFVAARAGGIREDILRKWKEGLEVLAGVDTEATPRLSENEAGFSREHVRLSSPAASGEGSAASIAGGELQSTPRLDRRSRAQRRREGVAHQVARSVEIAFRDEMERPGRRLVDALSCRLVCTGNTPATAKPRGRRCRY
jgi:hypothetical protein